MTDCPTYCAEPRGDLYLTTAHLLAVASCVERNWPNPDNIRIRPLFGLPNDVTATPGMTIARPAPHKSWDVFPPLSHYPIWTACAFECSHADGSRWLLWSDIDGNAGEITGRALGLLAERYGFEHKTYLG